MKFITLALVAASSVALFANGNSSSATAQVGVQIVAPISIVNPDQSKLDFGMVTVNDPSQPITIAWLPSPTGAGTPTYANCDPYAGIANNAPRGFAWFRIRKDHDLGWNNVSISVPKTVSLGKGVTVTTQATGLVPSSSDGQPAYLSNTTDKDMSHFWVGGTLEADANTFGIYSATMTVTANYQ